MDGERSDRGGEPEVEDEFACPGMLRGSLASLHGTVERIFKVTFGIGEDDLAPGNNGQIWLKLRGSSNNVQAAKVRHVTFVPAFFHSFISLSFFFFNMTAGCEPVCRASFVKGARFH